MGRYKVVVVLSILICACSASKPPQPGNGGEKYIVGYLFPGDSLINGDVIAVEKLTHIMYAFANIKNGKIQQGFKHDIDNFRILNQAKKRNPSLKILISVGGWTWSGGFSDMGLTRESRAKFITSVLRFIGKNKLDGIDIDWEFPNLFGYGNTYRPEDKENFTSLLKELRNALDKLGEENHKHYLLTAATGAFDDYLANTEMGKDQKYLDFLNIMAYDFYVPSADSIAGHNAPLYTSARDPGHSSADAMVQEYIDSGVSPEKIVLGVPFYGHIWQVKSADYNGLYEPGGPAEQHINGSFGNIERNFIDKKGFVRYWDSTSHAPYLFNKEKKVLITYDDEQSLREKCRYIKTQNLKGVMFWRYNSDHKMRLLQTLYNCLNEKRLSASSGGAL